MDIKDRRGTRTAAATATTGGPAARTDDGPAATPKPPTTRRAKREAAELLAAVRRRRGRRVLLASSLAVVLAVVGAVTAILVDGNGPTSDSGEAAGVAVTAASPAVVAAITKVDPAKLDDVRFASAGLIAPPRRVSGQNALALGGKPEVLYMGAEYCSLCAAQRWPLVIALAQFGTFTGLGETYSAAAPEPYPHTPTLSFHGATYHSDYISFVPVEMQSGRPVAGTGTYATLDAPTAPQLALLSSVDVSGSTSGTIPFVDYGNQYAQVSGANFSPGVLAGYTPEQVAAVLSGSPSAPLSQAIFASADAATAMICALTGGRPAAVCNRSGVETALTGIMSSQTG